MLSQPLWFLDTLVRVRVSHREGTDRISVLEHLAPQGDSPPLHIHHTEDEVFHVIEGTLQLRVGAEDRTLGSGEGLLAPKGVPHTYRVLSDRARWLTVTTGRDFEDFVRAMARPALRPELPPPGGPPTPEAAAVLAETALRYGIEIVGPPLR
ncbi:MAG: cupin domain-containing protein [bacterium]